MKGAKCSYMSRLCSSRLAGLYGRSSGLLRSTSRRTSTALPTSALSSGVSSVASGMRSALSATLLVCLSLVLSLSFPSVAHASIAVTAWEGFWNAMRAMDLVTGAWRTANAAEELRDLSAQIGMFTGSRGDRQYIAKELEKVSGYDIDLDNGYMATVYGVTGNSNYSPVRQCSNCLGGYLAVDNQQVTCPVCHGTATVFWEQVPYTATIEAAQELSAWINYLTATQTDWSSGGSGGSGSAIDTGSNMSFIGTAAATETNITSNVRADCYNYTYSNDTVTYGSRYGRYLSCSPSQTNSADYCAELPIYGSSSFASWVSEMLGSGNDIAFYTHPDTTLHMVVAPSGSVTISSSLNSCVISWSNGADYRSNDWKFLHDDEGGRIYIRTYYQYSDTSGTYSNSCGWYVLLTSTNAGGSSGGSSGGVTGWGVDVDWYGDESDASAAGDTYITNEGDTIYNEENNTYTTTYNMDVEPITQRLDILNAINAQIGVDLRTLDASMFKELNDLEWWLQKIYYNVSTLNNTLEAIRQDMANLDRSTNDLVDLSTLESGVSGLLSDIGALLSAVTGSHGADALGLYGRLDTVLNWLDDFTPVDVSGIEQILEDWPDYPVFDDSDLLNAITGSHGSDLLGLFGRFDNVLSWLDSYVAPDLATLNHQLGDLLDSDGQTPTVHGLLHWINYYAQDADRAIHDVLALGTVTVNGTTYGFTDLLYNTWLDLSRLVGMSTVTAGEDTYSFADLLYNVWVDFGRLRDWLVEWWADLFARLDDIIDAIEDLPHDGANPWHTSPVVDPSDPEGGPIIGPIETDPYGYPKMPDWTVYKEPLNIPALEHAVDELMTKFPFSMLNTIIQVAMFIERPAVAPQFDIPAPNPSDWSQPYLVHVDLSDYDTVAATLRLGIVIWAIVKISNRTINMWVGDKGGD